MSTLAMQYIVDFVISHVPAISGGSQATLQAPPVRLLGMPLTADAAYYVVLAVCAFVTAVHAQRAPHAASAARWRRCARRTTPPQIIGVRPSATSCWPSGSAPPSSAASPARCSHFAYYKAVTPEQFHLELSIQMLAMVIVGGLGSVLGCYFGAALILLRPVC